MIGLVLLADEVALLKLAAAEGLLVRTADASGHTIVCDFFCDSGMAARQGNQIRLTLFGKRLAHRLIATGASGTVSIPPDLLDALGLQVAIPRQTNP